MATYLDLKTDVERELNLQDEDLVTPAEMLKYANEAIDSAEALIINLNEDYFLAEPFTITLVSGQSGYSLPSDIYAQKIRAIIYNNGNKIYRISKASSFEDFINLQVNADFKYIVTNSYTNGVKLVFGPTPQEAGAFITVYYLRNAQTLVNDTDVIDLPEAYNYILQYVKDKCINKERFTPDAGPSPALVEEQKKLLTTLHQRFVDEKISETSIDEYINEVI